VSRIPFPAAFLGGAGLIPFVGAVLLLSAEEGAVPRLGIVSCGAEGAMFVLANLGAILLGFMGGCIWGFASAPGRTPSLLVLTASVLPAILAFLAIRPDPALSCLWLAFGFVALQAIDVALQRAGITPDYWLNLRLPLTAGVVACLLTGALYG